VKLLKDGSTFTVGNIRVEAVHTPGHTPEHISFLITDIGGGADEPIALATGDFLFVGDVGRPDLLESAAGIKDAMEPSARTLRASLSERLKPYGDYVQILPAHGAGSACGKSLGAVPISTLGYERRFNAPFKLAMSNEESFVKDILQGQPEPPPYFATMKRVNRDGIRITGHVPTAPHLSGAQLAATISRPDIKILDTRMNKESFSERHVAKAIWAPLHSAFFSVAAGSYLNESEKILLIVERDPDAENALRQLYRIGFDAAVGWATTAEAESVDAPHESTERVAFASFTPSAIQKDGALIDVRSTSEHQTRHIPGSISIPYTRLKTRLNELPRDKKLYVHCASGKRAALATSYLRSLGYSVVHIDGDFSSRCANDSCGIV
jgi:hydroxyacylglutathione hydrolase